MKLEQLAEKINLGNILDPSDINSSDLSQLGYYKGIINSSREKIYEILQNVANAENFNYMDSIWGQLDNGEFISYPSYTAMYIDKADDIIEHYNYELTEDITKDTLTKLSYDERSKFLETLAEKSNYFIDKDEIFLESDDYIIQIYGNEYYKEIVRAAYYGEYDLNDKYFGFDVYGNIQSSEYEFEADLEEYETAIINEYYEVNGLDDELKEYIDEIDIDEIKDDLDEDLLEELGIDVDIEEI